MLSCLITSMSSKKSSYNSNNNNKWLSYHRETLLQGGLVMAKSGRLELGDNIYAHYRSIYNHCDVFGQQSNKIRWERKISAITLFKVIEVGTSRMPVCNFLLVINSNWQPILYHCGVIAAYCSNFGHVAFLSHPLGDLGKTYDVHLGLIGKRIVEFLLVIIELFRQMLRLRHYERK